MAHVAQKVSMKIMTVLVGIPVGRAVKAVVESTWSTVRPADTARRPAERGVRWGDAVGWAALSASGYVVADLVTRLGAEEVWRTVLGTEPPPRSPIKAERKAAKAQHKAESSSRTTAPAQLSPPR